MILYRTAHDDRDLMGIIALQRKNLPVSLQPDEMKSQGFVTVVHTLDVLRSMNAIEQSVIATDHGQVIAYLLAMTCASKFDIPVLVPMFETFETIPYRGNSVAEYPYIVVGQVCVDKAYRGKGILDKCYAYYRERFSSRYDFAITEIDGTNTRSIQAHKRIGFEVLFEYYAPDQTKWCIVIWDWRQPAL